MNILFRQVIMDGSKNGAPTPDEKLQACKSQLEIVRGQLELCTDELRHKQLSQTAADLYMAW